MLISAGSRTPAWLMSQVLTISVNGLTILVAWETNFVIHWLSFVAGAGGPEGLLACTRY
jgi:hypothetical protein